MDDGPLPDFSMDGLRSGLPHQIVMDTWREYRKQGTLLLGGGFLDQPHEWWQDIWLCDAIHAVASEEARKEKENAGNN